MCYHEWIRNVCEVLQAGIDRAEPTGSNIEPRAIVSFSVELLQKLITEAPESAHG